MPVIINALNKFIDTSVFIIDHSYEPPLWELCEKYTANSIPVIIWATTDMSSDNSIDSYALWICDGSIVTYHKQLHCLVLVGYDDQYYYFNNPLAYGSPTPYAKSKVEAAYQLLSSQSIAIYKIPKSEAETSIQEQDTQ